MPSVTIRFPDELLAELKEASTRTGIPYQTLVKAFVQDGLERMKATGKVPEEVPDGRRRHIPKPFVARTPGERTPAFEPVSEDTAAEVFDQL